MSKSKAIVAVAATTALAFAAAPAASANTSSTSVGGDQGVVLYDAIGGTNGALQASGPFALSMQLFGSLLPGGGGGQTPGDASASLTLLCDGSGVAEYDNTGASSGNSFRLLVDGDVVDQRTVARGEREAVAFTDATYEVEIRVDQGSSPMSVAWELVPPCED